MRQEIKELIEYVEQHKDRAIKEVIEEYFKLISWSLEKDEWDNHMSDGERELFIKSVKQEVQDDNESE